MHTDSWPLSRGQVARVYVSCCPLMLSECVPEGCRCWFSTSRSPCVWPKVNRKALSYSTFPVLNPTSHHSLAASFPGAYLPPNHATTTNCQCAASSALPLNQSANPSSECVSPSNKHTGTFQGVAPDLRSSRNKAIYIIHKAARHGTHHTEPSEELQKRGQRE